MQLPSELMSFHPLVSIHKFIFNTREEKKRRYFLWPCGRDVNAGARRPANLPDMLLQQQQQQDGLPKLVHKHLPNLLFNHRVNEINYRETINDEAHARSCDFEQDADFQFISVKITTYITMLLNGNKLI